MHTGISRASRALKATAIAKWIADDRMPTCEVPPDLWAEQPRLQEIVSCMMPLARQPMVQIPGEPVVEVISLATSARKGVPPFPCTPEDCLCLCPQMM